MVSLDDVEQAGISLKGTLYKNGNGFGNGKGSAYIDWQLDFGYNPGRQDTTITPTINWGSKF